MEGLHGSIQNLQRPPRVVPVEPAQHHVRLISENHDYKQQLAAAQPGTGRGADVRTCRAKWSARAAPQPPEAKDRSVMESPKRTSRGRIFSPSLSPLPSPIDHGSADGLGRLPRRSRRLHERLTPSTVKILVPHRKKIPGVGIAGYRGYRKIPTGYRTNLKSKI
jgi:hypothetical protein